MFFLLKGGSALNHHARDFVLTRVATLSRLPFPCQLGCPPGSALVNPTDVALSVAQQPTAGESWGSHTRPHDVAEVLSLLLPLLPLDARALAACVCRDWRVAASAPALWAELSFEWCAARVNDAALAALCARAGAELRVLRLDSEECTRVTCAGVLAALRDGGCTGVRRLWAAPRNQGNARCLLQDWLTPKTVQQLAAACPVLELAACSARCRLSDAAAVVTALPGPLTLKCTWNIKHLDVTHLTKCLRSNTTLTSLNLSEICIGEAGLTQLAESLRVNSTLKSLHLSSNNVGVHGATQLAESLRVNATLTSLRLCGSLIGDPNAMQVAECLRVNTTLTCLVLSCNRISDAGATQLAECLRVNATLTSLYLVENRISDAGAMQLADCLRINATLKIIVMFSNRIGDAGATQLAECLHVNATLTTLCLGRNLIGDVGATQFGACLRDNSTLTNLDLACNNIGDDGATQLADCLRANATLTHLSLWRNDTGVVGARALEAACPPQCDLSL